MIQVDIFHMHNILEVIFSEGEKKRLRTIAYCRRVEHIDLTEEQNTENTDPTRMGETEGCSEDD